MFSRFCLENGHPMEFTQHFTVTSFGDRLELVVECRQCGAKWSGSVTCDELVEKLGDNFYRVET